MLGQGNSTSFHFLQPSSMIQNFVRKHQQNDFTLKCKQKIKIPPKRPKMYNFYVLQWMFRSFRRVCIISRVLGNHLLVAHVWITSELRAAQLSTAYCFRNQIKFKNWRWASVPLHNATQRNANLLHSIICGLCKGKNAWNYVSRLVHCFFFRCFGIKTFSEYLYSFYWMSVEEKSTQ